MSKRMKLADLIKEMSSKKRVKKTMFLKKELFLELLRRSGQRKGLIFSRL